MALEIPNKANGQAFSSENEAEKKKKNDEGAVFKLLVTFCSNLGDFKRIDDSKRIPKDAATANRTYVTSRGLVDYNYPVNMLLSHNTPWSKDSKKQ